MKDFEQTPGDDHGDDRGGSQNEHGKSLVAVTIDNTEYMIHRGRQTVADIKALGGVPLAHELELKEEDGLTPLDDAGAVTIKGGERFVSHPRIGASS